MSHIEVVSSPKRDMRETPAAPDSSGSPSDQINKDAAAFILYSNTVAALAIDLSAALLTLGVLVSLSFSDSVKYLLLVAAIMLLVSVIIKYREMNRLGKTYSFKHNFFHKAIEYTVKQKNSDKGGVEI